MNTLGYLLFIFHETTNERQLTGLLPYWLIPGHAYSLQYCPFSFVFVHGMRGHLAVRKNCLSSSKSGGQEKLLSRFFKLRYQFLQISHAISTISYR
jgi:hypothetical protein